MGVEADQLDLLNYQKQIRNTSKQFPKKVQHKDCFCLSFKQFSDCSRKADSGAEQALNSGGVITCSFSRILSYTRTVELWY